MCKQTTISCPQFITVASKFLLVAAERKAAQTLFSRVTFKKPVCLAAKSMLLFLCYLSHSLLSLSINTKLNPVYVSMETVILAAVNEILDHRKNITYILSFVL